MQTPSLKGYYGSALERLRQIKSMVDPLDYFKTTPMSIGTNINITAALITSAPALVPIPEVSVYLPVPASIPAPAPTLELMAPISTPPPQIPAPSELVRPSLISPNSPVLSSPISSGGYRIKPSTFFFAPIISQLIQFSSLLFNRFHSLG